MHISFIVTRCGKEVQVRIHYWSPKLPLTALSHTENSIECPCICPLSSFFGLINLEAQFAWTKDL